MGKMGKEYGGIMGMVGMGEGEPKVWEMAQKLPVRPIERIPTYTALTIGVPPCTSLILFTNNAWKSGE